MSASRKKDELKFIALADTAVAAGAGEPIEQVAQLGLQAASGYLDLVAGALILWDANGEITVKAIAAASDTDRDILMDTEHTLLTMLRRKYKLTLAYMELGGEQNRSIFSLPVEYGGHQFGALIGIKTGSARLHDSDDFLRALAAILTLAIIRSGPDTPTSDKSLEARIKEARDAAIIELAVAINHEINNPLTALMGNLQLLSMKNKDLSDDVRARLETIDNSANQIKEVTARLMKAAEAPSIVYTGNMKMIDLSGKKSSEVKDIEEPGNRPDEDEKDVSK